MIEILKRESPTHYALEIQWEIFPVSKEYFPSELNVYLEQ